MARSGLEKPTIFAMIDHIIEGLPPALIGREQCLEFRQAAEQLLPSKSGLSLECRLENGDSRCDFLSMVYRHELGFLAESYRSSKYDSIRTFFREWNNPQSVLNRIPAVALECDIVDGHVHSPFVSATIEPEFERGAQVVLSQRRMSDANHDGKPNSSGKSIAGEFVRCVDAGDVSPGVLSTLSKCFDFLTPHGCIYHVSSQYHRSFQPKPIVRIIVSLPTSQIVEYLTRIEWHGNTRQLNDLLPKILPYTHRANFDVYIEEGRIHPIIGVYMQFFSPRTSESRWRKMCAWLRTLSTCCPKKLIGLEHWVANAESMPLYRQELGLKVKIGHRENEGPVVKAYFSYLPRSYRT